MIDLTETSAADLLVVAIQSGEVDAVERLVGIRARFGGLAARRSASDAHGPSCGDGLAWLFSERSADRADLAGGGG